MAKFALLYIVLQAAIQFSPLGPLENAIASIEAGWLGLENEGSLIHTSNGLFEINASCTGLVSASVLAAVIFALKKPKLKKKIAVFLAGGISLFVLNFVRVFVVLLVAQIWGSGAAEIVHTVSWISTAALVLTVWYFGMKKIAKVKDFSSLL